MDKAKDKHREAYREEALELLNELEESLLELEDNRSDKEIISRVFRALHTIKGSGAMFGFDEIASFTHDVENIYELLRDGKADVTKPLIDLTLEARDHMRLLLDAGSGGEPADEEEGNRILAALKATLPAETLAGESIEARAEEQKIEETYQLSGQEMTYRVFFRPHQNILLKGINPLFMLDDLRALGRNHIMAYLSEIPEIEEISPEASYIYWDILLTTDRPASDIRDVFMFVEDEAEISIDLIDEGGLISGEADYKKLGEILIERGDLKQDDIEAVLGGRKLLGEMIVDSGIAPPMAVKSALAEQEFVKDVRKKRRALDQASTVRVPAEKLDRLVDLVGEMVTMQARLTQIAFGRKDPLLTSVSEEVERLTAELHDSAMNIRMVPIGSTFSKFRRLVRDLSSDLERDINLIMEGAETELDKTVIDKLNDPLVHIIRNSIDHGIEKPSEREAAGKHRQGTIKISALHSGSDVLIKIQDDGAGIDTKAVFRKASDLGLASQDHELTEHEIFNVLFQPGFSTATKVSSVSGRGVGMDVVKRSVESLRGTVECSSRKGLGTTITLRIPLTLAIIEGLLIKVAESFFVMPLLAVEECVELSTIDAHEEYGRSLVDVRGELVPYIRLRQKFAIDGERPALEQVVIIRHEDKRIGFSVDEVVGEHQTVLKSLSRVYKNIRAISGATILGNGTVALILDLPKLIEDAEYDEALTTGRDLGQQHSTEN
jgi:two-component system chemotaxis sensor kinase CheA